MLLPMMVVVINVVGGDVFQGDGHDSKDEEENYYDDDDDDGNVYV